MALELAHAVVYVNDMAGMIDFYEKVLGLQVTDRGPLGADSTPEIVFLSNHPRHHHQLAFIGTREEVGASNSVNHLAFRVEDLDAVKRTIDTVETDGRATAIRPRTHGNAWSVYFADPEQNGVEVFCDTPFFCAQPQGRSWDPAMSEEELLAWTEKEFADEPRFGDIEDFYAEHAERLTGR
jgi:catechol 2,3-dioxygenase